MTPRNMILRIVLIALAGLTAACSHMQPPANSREALDQRVEQLWKARMAKDNGAVYDLTDLTYQQDVTRDQFMQKTGFMALSYEIQDIAIEGDDALVKVVFETRKMAMKMKLNLREKWIFEQGAWRLDLTDMMSKGPFGPWGTGVKKK